MILGLLHSRLLYANESIKLDSSAAEQRMFEDFRLFPYSLFELPPHSWARGWSWARVRERTRERERREDRESWKVVQKQPAQAILWAKKSHTRTNWKEIYVQAKCMLSTISKKFNEFALCFKINYLVAVYRDGVLVWDEDQLVALTQRPALLLPAGSHQSDILSSV